MLTSGESERDPGKGEGPNRLDAAARPAGRRNPQGEKKKHKSPEASGGRPSEKRSLGPPPSTQDRDPHEATSRVPGLPHQLPACPSQDTLGAWRGGGERVAAVRFCAFRWGPQAGRIVRISSACRSVRGAGQACSAPGWERHPECIRCRAGNPPCAAGSAQRAPAPRAVPTESRGGPGAPESLSEASLSP